LQFSPKVYGIYLTKDKNFEKFKLSLKFVNKALSFEFLNGNPK
jgi:hypothetical protein